MLDTLKTVATGTAGIAGTQLLDMAAAPPSSLAETIVKVAVQVFIGVMTIIQLFKQKKRKAGSPL